MKKTIKLRDPCTYSESSYASSCIFPNHITCKEEATGITVAEIDSSNSSESGYEVEKCERKHAWCYVDNNEQHMNDAIYNVNKNASEKRRMKNKVCPEFISRDIEYVRYKNNESNSDHIYTGFYNHKWRNAKEDTSTKNPLNCFTIISNELADSESLSDKENGVEKIQCGDVVLESDYWNNNDDNNNSKYNSYKDLDNSKRTIWIYSFKNKNILNEDITAPINISSTDSNSSTSVDYEDREKVENRSKTKYQYRVASPTPATYVPRLNFYVAATLPTVTEITEPYQYTTNAPISLKSDNFPLEENNTKTINSNNFKEDICFKESTISATNVINWLALSPRTKRRNLKLPKLINKNYVIEEGINNDEKCKLKCNSLWNTLNVNETTFASTPDQKCDNNSVVTYVATKKDEQTYFKSISTDQEKVESLIDEKGDYKKMKLLKKPHIRINQLIKKELTTDPIENLNGDGWIGDKKEHGNKENFYNDEIDSIENKDRLFSKNMPLLKPVEWSEFLPITESVPSLYLSLPSDINEDKQCWFKRIIKCICCIKCK